MSGTRRGGAPPRQPYYDQRRSSYEDNSGRFQDREARQVRDRDQDWDPYDEHGRGRGRGQPRSRSPSWRSGQNESRPARYEQPKRIDSRGEQSSSASSIAGSPLLSSGPSLMNDQSKTRSGSSLDTVMEATEAPSLPDPQAPLSIPMDPSAAMNDIITAFQTLAQKSLRSSALIFELDSAKKVLEEREAEFTKSAPQHLKFPNTKGFQSEAKVLAEDRCKAIDDALAEESKALNILAAEVVQKLVPEVALMTSTKKEKELLEQNEQVLNRCNTLERSLRDLTDTVKLQTNYIEDLQKSKKELKDNQVRTEGDMQLQFAEANRKISVSTNSISRIGSQLTDASLGISGMEEENLSLKISLAAAKDAITRVELKSNELIGLRLEFDKFKIEQLSKVAEISGTVQESHDIIQQSVESLNALKKQVETENSDTNARLCSLKDGLAGLQAWAAAVKAPAHIPPPIQQASFSNDMLTSSINRINSTEKRLEILESKISSLDKAQEGGNLLTSRLSGRFEARQTSCEDVANRVAKVEEAQKSTRGFKIEFEKAFKTDLKLIEKRLDQMKEGVSMSLKEDFKGIEHRMDRIEKASTSTAHFAKPPQVSPLPSDNSAAIAPELMLRLERLESNIDLCKSDLSVLRAGQDSFLEGFSNTVDESVNNAIEDEIDPRLKSIENTLATLNALSELPARLQILEETQRLSNVTQMNGMAEANRDLEATVISKVLELVRTDPSILSQQLENRLSSFRASVTNSIATMGKDVVSNSNAYDLKFSTLSHEVEALANVANNHEARMNNISTGSLVNYMLDQLGELFPNLQICQQLRTEYEKQKLVLQTNGLTMEEFKTAQDGFATKLRALNSSTLKVTNAVLVLENMTVAKFENLMGRTAKSVQAVASLGQQTAAQLGAYKQELNALKKDKPSSVDNETKDQVKIVSDQLKTIQEQLATIQASEPSDITAQLPTINGKLTTVEEQIQTQAVSQDRLSKLIEDQIATVKEQIEVVNINQQKIPDIENQIAKIKEQVETMKDNQRNTNREKIPSIEMQLAEFDDQIQTIRDFIQETGPRPPTMAPLTQNEVNGNKSLHRENPNSHTPNSASRHRTSTRTVDGGRNRKDSPVRSDLNPNGNRKRKQLSSTPSSAHKTSSKNANTSSASKKARTQPFLLDTDSEDASNFAMPTYGGAMNDD